MRVWKRPDWLKSNVKWSLRNSNAQMVGLLFAGASRSNDIERVFFWFFSHSRYDLEIHAAAKETVALAEERFLSNSHNWTFDNTWQEMLNHATNKVDAIYENSCQLHVK